MALNKVTLTVNVQDAQGNQLTSGEAVFVPTSVLTDATNHVLATQAPIVVPFLATGVAPTVSLYGTDNATIAQNGSWAWKVHFTGLAASPAPYTFSLPFAGGASQNLSDVTVVTISGTVQAYAPLASPAFTGTPTAPTAAALDNSTKLATTAYSDAAVGVEKTRALAAEALLAPKASPALTGTPTAPTAGALDNSTKLATTAYADAAVSVEKARAQAAEVVLDVTAGDIQPTSTAAAAGNKGQAADAKHVHLQNYFGYFGNGSDGSVTLDGATTFNNFSSLAGSIYTLTRDVYATNLTINNTVTLITANFRIFCMGTFTNNGTLRSFSPNNASGITAGVAPGSGSLQGGQAGTNGATGVGALGITSSGCIACGNGGSGGSGTSGAGGGVTNAKLAATWPWSNPLVPQVGFMYAKASGNVSSPAPGVGGSSGAGDGVNSGGGGGSGASGVVVLAWAFVNGASGTISAIGGNGGTPPTGNCGGGGGGGGGVIAIYTLTAWTNNGATNVSGGNGGNGVGTGTAGAAGTSGNVINTVVA